MISKGMKPLFVHVFGVLIVIFCISPVLVIGYASFKTLNTYESFAFTNGTFTLSNYTDLLKDKIMGRWIWNSVFVCSVTTILTVTVDMLAAFAFAKIPFKGRNIMFLIMLSTLMLPFSITLVPTYLLVVKFGMVDSYLGLIMPLLAGPFGVYLLRQFIISIPNSLLEAAKMDGATTFRVFRSVILPMSVQPMVVLGILTFVNTWNSFLWPLLVTQSQKMMTLTVGIATTHQQFTQNLGAMTASAMISLAPMVLIFFFFQRFFLQGVAAGALKE